MSGCLRDSLLKIFRLSHLISSHLIAEVIHNIHRKVTLQELIPLNRASVESSKSNNHHGTLLCEKIQDQEKNQGFRYHLR